MKRPKSILTALAACAIALSAPHAAQARSLTHVHRIYAPGRLGAALQPFRSLRSIVRPSRSIDDVDLRSLAPPAGDQGSLPSCASWVVSEYRYALARNAGTDPGPFAPMYLYAQIVHGFPVGTTLNQNLRILEDQGIEPASQYSLGPTRALDDDSDQPNAEDRARAAQYRLTGYGWRYIPHAGEQTVVAWMAQNHLPIVIILGLTYRNFDDAGHTDPAGVSYPLLIGPPTPGMSFGGGHMVIGYSTDAQGVWFLNSWGTGYGQNGWAELSWSALAATGYVYVLEKQDAAPSRAVAR
jgi:hypothetical protein